MEENRGKLVRVTLEYENVKESLEKESAIEWLDKINDMCTFMENRGLNPFVDAKFDWKIEKK